MLLSVAVTETRLATFQAVCDHLAASRLADDRAEVSIDSDSQRVTFQLRDTRVHGEPWLEITSLIGPARFLSPAMLMIANVDLAAATLAIAHDGTLLLRQTLPLGGLRAVDLDAALVDIAGDTVRGKKGVDKPEPVQ